MKQLRAWGQNIRAYGWLSFCGDVAMVLLFASWFIQSVLNHLWTQAVLFAFFVLSTGKQVYDTIIGRKARSLPPANTSPRATLAHLFGALAALCLFLAFGTYFLSPMAENSLRPDPIERQFATFFLKAAGLFGGLLVLNLVANRLYGLIVSRNWLKK